MMTLGAWLDTRGIQPFPPEEFTARFKSNHELDTLLGLHDRCREGQCSRVCTGQLPYPSLERDGSLIDRWAPCPRERMKRAQAKAARLLAASGLPMGYRTKSLDTFEVADGTRDAWEAVCSRIDRGNRRGLVLCGTPGTGKTHLAAAMLNHRLARELPAIFAVAARLLDDLRAAEMSNKGADVRKLVDEVPLLVLDDLGKERSTAYAGEQLFRLVDSRLSQERQTIVTTNAGDPGELRKALGEMHGPAIVSRLLESCEWVKLEGRDRRMPAQGGLL